MKRLGLNSYKAMFAYKDFWMGIAIIMVLIFHCGLYPTNRILADIRAVVYTAVDVMVFASGIGCACSLLRKPDATAFYLRRILRIYPIYIPFMIIWIPYQMIYHNMTVNTAIGNLIGIQGIIGNGGEFNWYISFMLITYIIAPIIMPLISKVDSNFKLVIVIVVMELLTLPFWNVNHLIIGAVRIPIFILGMFFGKKVSEDEKIAPKSIGVFFILFVAGAVFLMVAVFIINKSLWAHGWYWYPTIFMLPFACLVLSYIAKFCEKTRALKWIYIIMCKLGKHSFEIYLVHIFMLQILKDVDEKGIVKYNSISVLLTYIMTLLPAYALNRVSKIIIKKYNKV